MKKIPHRFRMIVFVMLMTFFMGLLLSAIMTLKENGLTDNFFTIWIHRFLTTWLIVIPTVAVVIPIVNWISNRIVESTEA